MSSKPKGNGTIVHLLCCPGPGWRTGHSRVTHSHPQGDSYTQGQIYVIGCLSDHYSLS